MIEIHSGTIHELPIDIQEVLLSDGDLREKWNKLTPLARNERICWITIVKKQETREEHVERLREDVGAGKKRPCCWPGCPHRRETAKKRFKGLKEE